MFEKYIFYPNCGNIPPSSLIKGGNGSPFFKGDLGGSKNLGVLF
jgi:hypothetical protein